MTSTQIKAWRTRHKVSQERLAQLLTVDPMTVSRWERGIQTAPGFLALALEALTAKLPKGKK